MVKTWVKRLYMAFIFLLLYLPIIVLVVLSFNKSKARVAWRGFTFQSVSYTHLTLPTN